MSTIPELMKLGAPYLMVRDGVEWTGMRHKRPSPDEFAWNPAGHVIEVIDAWMMFRSSTEGEITYEMAIEAPECDSIVPLVPARPVTRADLPPWGEVEELIEQAPWDTSTADVVLNASVAHLNANGGIPAESPRKSDYVLNKGKCCEEEQGEIEGLKTALRRANDARSMLLDNGAGLTKRAEKSERERDEAVARAGRIADECRDLDGKLTRACSEIGEARARAEKADAITDAIMALAPAPENRPTLDRDAVLAELNHRFGEYGSQVAEAADAIIALTEQVAS